LDEVEPFLMLALDDDPARQLARAKVWARKNHGAAARPLLRTVGRGGKIRLGYFSADFHDHATMHLMAGLLERHDRARFELHLFSFGEDRTDAMRRRAVDAADRFHDVTGLGDDAIVALARDSGIDIAVDLKGYTRDSRAEIFARRAAPIQVSYLGFPGTMGAEFIDYLIADRWVVPEAEQGFYAEKVV